MIFGARERAEYSQLKVPKRKVEWAASRLAVKQLISASDRDLAQYQFSQIQILKEPSGAPYIEIDGRMRLPGWASLSHSRGHALVAYSPDDIRFGVDLEYIESRSMDFARDFFTEKEAQLVISGDPKKNMIITTIIWSAKEAVLKAIVKGLRVDTKMIEISLTPDSIDDTDWSILELNSPKIPITSPRLMWRREGDFIQTICLLDDQDQTLEWVSI